MAAIVATRLDGLRRGLVTAALAAFVVIVPVELPDKTFVATLVLATRYRPWPVWLGVTAAFGVQCLVAVAAGRLLTLLPERPVQLAAAALFVVGAVVLFGGARKADAEEAGGRARVRGAGSTDSRTGWRAAGPASWCCSRPSGATCRSC